MYQQVGTLPCVVVTSELSITSEGEGDCLKGVTVSPWCVSSASVDLGGLKILTGVVFRGVSVTVEPPARQTCRCG